MRFTAIDKELKAAKERIGYTPEKALQWLLDRFVEPKKPILSDNGTDLSPSEVDQLGYEVNAFQDTDWGENFRMYGMVRPAGKAYKIERGQVFPNTIKKEALATIQKEVVLLIERFLTEKVVPQTISNVTYELIRMEDRSVLYIEVEATRAFILCCFFLLAAVGDRLRRCKAEDCNRLFVFQHAKKRFCSDRCQTRIGTRLFRNRRKKTDRHRKSVKKTNL
jgi:hypothetical protein